MLDIKLLNKQNHLHFQNKEIAGDISIKKSNDTHNNTCYIIKTGDIIVHPEHINISITINDTVSYTISRNYYPERFIEEKMFYDLIRLYYDTDTIGYLKQTIKELQVEWQKL